MKPFSVIFHKSLKQPLVCDLKLPLFFYPFSYVLIFWVSRFSTLTAVSYIASSKMNRSPLVGLGTRGRNSGQPHLLLYLSSSFSFFFFCLSSSVFISIFFFLLLSEKYIKGEIEATMLSVRFQTSSCQSSFDTSYPAFDIFWHFMSFSCFFMNKDIEGCICQHNLECINLK